MIMVKGLTASQATNIKHLLECNKWAGVKICKDINFHKYQPKEADKRLTKEYEFDALQVCEICSMGRLDSVHLLDIVLP